jgi:MFS family permease
VVLQVASVAAIVAAANTSAKPWPVPAALGLAGGLAVLVLVLRERSTALPLVPAGLWRRPFVAGLVGSFGITATTSSLVVVGTLFLQETKGFSPGAAGLMILPFSLAVVVGAGAAGRLMPHTGSRFMLVLGLLMILAGGTAMAFWSATGTLVVALVLAGLGNGIGAVAAYALGTTVAAEHQGSAAGLLNTAAQIGTATMVAITVAVASREDGLDYRVGWLTVAVTALILMLGVVSSTIPSEAGDRAGSKTGQCAADGRGGQDGSGGVVADGNGSGCGTER